MRSGETELLDHSIYEFEFNAQLFDPPTQPQVTEFALVPNNEQRSVEVSLTISDAIDGFAQYQPGRPESTTIAVRIDFNFDDQDADFYNMYFESADEPLERVPINSDLLEHAFQQASRIFESPKSRSRWCVVSHAPQHRFR